MTLETVRKQAEKLQEDLYKLKLYNLSWKSILQSMYEEASRKKHYFKCSLIEQLIIEDINS